MSLKPFVTTGDFTYSARVTPIPLRGQALNLRITTRWASSRTPDTENVAFNVTLTPAQIKTLIATLQEGLDEAEGQIQRQVAHAACA